jgi:hypothetical protein
MAKIRVSFFSEEDRDKVTSLCHRLGRVRATEEASLVVKLRHDLSVKKVGLFLGIQPKIISVNRVR